MNDTILLFSTEEIKLILTKYYERCTGKAIEEMSGQSLLYFFEATRAKDLLKYLYCHMQ